MSMTLSHRMINLSNQQYSNQQYFITSRIASNTLGDIAELIRQPEFILEQLCQALAFKLIERHPSKSHKRSYEEQLLRLQAKLAELIGQDLDMTTTSDTERTAQYSAMKKLIATENLAEESYALTHYQELLPDFCSQCEKKARSHYLKQHQTGNGVLDLGLKTSADKYATKQCQIDLNNHYIIDWFHKKLK